jgi:PAS domain-containing protein
MSQSGFIPEKMRRFVEQPDAHVLAHTRQVSRGLLDPPNIVRHWFALNKIFALAFEERQQSKISLSRHVLLHLQNHTSNLSNALNCDTLMATTGIASGRKRSAEQLDMPAGNLVRKGGPATLNIFPFGRFFLTALQHLAVPLIVLDRSKKIVLANEAVQKILGEADQIARPPLLYGSTLYKKSLDQLGIELLEKDNGEFNTLDAFLDTLANNLSRQQPASHIATGNQSRKMTDQGHNDMGSQNCPNEASIDVMIIKAEVEESTIELPCAERTTTYATMSVTVWELEDQLHFTVAFTRVESPSIPREQLFVSEVADEEKPLNPQKSNGLWVFPEISTKTGPSVSEKVSIMKDAICNSITVPVFAMWKDGSVVFCNKGELRFLTFLRLAIYG